jgi:hypothetical protein
MLSWEEGNKLKKVWYLLTFLILMPGLFLVPGIGATDSQAAEGSGGGGAVTSVYTFYATASDGHIAQYGATYSTVHNAAQGVVGTGNQYSVGQMYYLGTYYIFRGGLFFNTASLPDGAVITGATLRLWGAGNYSTTDFNVTIVRGADLNNPLVAADYGDLLDETVSRGSLSTSGWVTGGWNSVSLNSTGLSEISKTGTTKFGLRSSRDIGSSTPYQNEYVQIGAYEGGHPAELAVTVASPPTVTTNAASNIASTSATLNGYLNDDGGQACQYRFEYGLTQSYGSATSWTGSITSGSNFSASVPGLTPHVTYHFRAQCYNPSTGVGSGGDRTFVIWGDEYNDAAYPEVGVEWIVHYDDEDDLPYADDSAEGFYNMLGSVGWTQRFDRGDNDAWERHFKRNDPGWNGGDNCESPGSRGADSVDIAWWQGHGGNVGGDLIFNVAQDDTDLQSNNAERVNEYVSGTGDQDEARFGDWDLEWVFLHTCYPLKTGPLQDQSGASKGNYDFGWALNGIHLICGFISTAYCSIDGPVVAHYLIDDPYDPYDVPYKVKLAWFMGEDDQQPGGTKLRVIGETDACGDDYIWGQGTVCADPAVNDYLSSWYFDCY